MGDWVHKMALGILNAMVPHLWQYLRYWWNEANFSSTRITFNRLYLPTFIRFHDFHWAEPPTDVVSFHGHCLTCYLSKTATKILLQTGDGIHDSRLLAYVRWLHMIGQLFVWELSSMWGRNGAAIHWLFIHGRLATRRRFVSSPVTWSHFRWARFHDH